MSFAEYKLLPPSQRRVLYLMLKGLTNGEIGEQLNITEKTVKYYITMIFRHLKVKSRGQLFALYCDALVGDRTLDASQVLMGESLHGT